MKLPRVDDVLADPALVGHPVAYALKKRAVQAHLAELRANREEATTEEVATAVARSWDALLVPRPQAVINATGVVLHTNLGRAPLAEGAVAAMVAAAGVCALEFEVETGRRGSRMTWLRPLLRALLAAEDVHAVNNGAAALLLACTTLGAPGGVVLSRGQMVEIGDGFRVAEMVTAGGVRVVEVGSTNRTHLADYAAAIEGGASAILWVHRSNFTQAGFVHQPTLRALHGLATERGVPLIADLGSGSLGGIGAEPTVQEYLSEGADVVTFSGDKLLGGPQAGLLAGRTGLVERCRRHPMARALRLDKTGIAALHATAAAHARGEALPLLARIAASVAELKARAGRIAAALGWTECVRDSEATIGGGSLPGEVLASVAIAVPTRHPDRVARALRLAGVIGRVQDDTLLLDLRGVAPTEDAGVVAALRGVTL